MSINFKIKVFRKYIFIINSYKNTFEIQSVKFATLKLSSEIVLKKITR